MQEKSRAQIINEKLQQAMPLNEMSMAWDYTNKNKSYCAWVEGPMGVDNRYFKFYNNDSPAYASKVARIRIDRAEYVGGNHNESNKQGKVENWILTNREKRLLITLLNSPSDDNVNCTKWQDILIRWNRDNFRIPANKTVTGQIDGYQAKKGVLDNIKPFSIDTIMPNYEEL